MQKLEPGKDGEDPRCPGAFRCSRSLGGKTNFQDFHQVAENLGTCNPPEGLSPSLPVGAFGTGKVEPAGYLPPSMELSALRGQMFIGS